MRRSVLRGSIVLSTALAAWAGGPADSALAAPLAWRGTLATRAAGLPPIAIAGGGVATVGGGGALPAHLATLRLASSRGGIAGTATGLVTDPEVAALGIAAVAVRAELGGGSFAPLSGAARSGAPLTRNTAPVRGLVRLCLLSTACNDFLAIPLTSDGTRGVGLGGQLAATSTQLGFQLAVSLEAAPWTLATATAVDQTDANTGSAAFHVVTRMGFAHGPASGTTSSAQPGAELLLVTPSQVRSNLTLGSNAKIAVLGELRIRFVPEPGRLLLLGAALTGLALYGGARRAPPRA